MSFYSLQSGKLLIECDVLVTRDQLNEEAPPGTTISDYFLIERISVLTDCVTSVSPLVRPYKVWFKKDGLWEKASQQVNVPICMLVSIKY